MWLHILATQNYYYYSFGVVENTSDLHGLKKKVALEPFPLYFSFIKKERKEIKEEQKTKFVDLRHNLLHNSFILNFMNLLFKVSFSK